MLTTDLQQSRDKEPDQHCCPGHGPGHIAWITAAICPITAIALVFIGQPIVCKCGGWPPWSWDIWSSHNSQHIIDPYTFTHLLHGILLCGCLYWLPHRVPQWFRCLIAIVLEALWEIVENLPLIIERYRMATISMDYTGDSVINSVADIVACAAGYAVAYRLRTIWSLALFFLTELVLLVTIRDGLILNVVMLLFPDESLRKWQMGTG